MASLLEKPVLVFSAASMLRLAMLFYGQWQDQHSALKYTDIDYYVFTDASRYVHHGTSPYLRDTYRYTPLLAWVLTPTAWSEHWFSFGKALFAVGDILTGWLMILILQHSRQFSLGRATRYASIWLLNPMVATISTRGSSEGMLAFVTMLLLWTAVRGELALTGVLLGFAVHLKIYPFIYAVCLLWAMAPGPSKLEKLEVSKTIKETVDSLSALVTSGRLRLALSSALTLTALNTAMYLRYGHEFLEHTFLYHLIRSDHRHNFSPYNTMLYDRGTSQSQSSFRPEAIAFLPQLILSAIILPLTLAKRDIASCQLAQTICFVAFNKVCTSQYFLWHMVYLPFYLPDSTLMQRASLGLPAVILWVIGQALWLQQGFKLEFFGISTFVNGLWFSSLAFFSINVWILGLVVDDTRRRIPPFPMK